jgi:hypothetical protein
MVLNLCGTGVRRSWLAAVLGAALLLGACGGGGGGGGTLPPPATTKAWQTAQLIETLNAGDAANPQIAVQANGSAMAVWRQSDGVRTNILASRYAPGSGWSTPEFVETDDADFAIHPQVAMDGNGNAIAVWVQEGGGRANIMASRFDGVRWSIAEPIEVDNAGDANFPQITMDANGNAFAVWQQASGPSNAAATRVNIWANRFVPGNGWQKAELIEADNAGDASLPQISMETNGSAIAVWEQLKGASTTATTAISDIWANRFDGNKWGEAKRIEADDLGGALRPQIAVDANGNALAVWLQRRAGQFSFSLMASRFTPAGDWERPVALQTGDGSAGDPQIAMDERGHAFAVWPEFAFEKESGQTWAARYVPGSGWAAAELVHDNTQGFNQFTQIAVDGGGNAMAVWVSANGPVNLEATQMTVLAARYVPGVGWLAAESIQAPGAGDGLRPALAMDANGNALAVWEQSSGPLFTDRVDIAGNVFR